MDNIIEKSKRILIKVGTRVLVDDNGNFDIKRLTHLVRQVSQLSNAQKEIIIVSSGAVALGREILNLGKKLNLEQKQACAAVGQARLINSYALEFSRFQLVAGQILLTGHELKRTESLDNLITTTNQLFKLNVIPIVNENDCLSIFELKEDPKDLHFDDNDQLAAVLATQISCDLLILLTDVIGLYEENPEDNPQAQQILKITDFNQLSSINMSGTSLYGRGGMSSKINSAKYASEKGVDTIITSGIRENSLQDLFDKNFSKATLIPQKKS